MTTYPLVFDTKNGRNCYVSGEVIIEGVRHGVNGGYVECNASLNSRAWNTTTEESKCPTCFPNRKFKPIQYDLFNQLTL